MYKNVKRGWYKLINTDKFIAQIDEHMGSYVDGNVQYKSNLELQAIRYCDFNKFIIAWSLEPFAINYIKPSDGKIHRYYVDLFIEFQTKDKFLVEIKPKSETVPPKKPKKVTEKSNQIYQKALLTYAINQAKWEQAKKFAQENNMKFVILTEEQLKL